MDDDYFFIVVFMNVVGCFVFDVVIWFFIEGYDGDFEDMGDFYY